MSLDSQIQEILMRSTPINDNTPRLQDGCKNINNTLTGINIVGDNNIIISSGIFSIVTIFMLACAFISLFGH